MERLSARLEDDAARVRTAAADDTLATWKAERPIARSVRSLAEDPQPQPRLAAAEGVGHLADTEAAEFICMLFLDRCPEIRDAARGAAEAIGAPCRPRLEAMVAWIDRQESVEAKRRADLALARSMACELLASLRSRPARVRLD